MTYRPEHPSTLVQPESVYISKNSEPGSADQERLINTPISIPGFGVIPARVLPPNVFYLGSPGAGKTNSMKMAAASSIPAASQFGGLRHRLAVEDFKCEWYPILRSLGVAREQLVVLNPFDRRVSAIDFARDFSTKADGTALTEFLLSTRSGEASGQASGGGDSKFFDEAARDIFHCGIRALQLIGKPWDLMTLVHAFSSEPKLRRLLSQTVAGRHSYSSFLQPEQRHAAAVFATVKSIVSAVEPIAIQLDRATTTVSLERWARGGGVLLLGSEPRHRELLAKFTEFVFERITRLLLARFDESPVDETWLFIDELRACGRLPSLPVLLSTGRSKGVRTFLGTQNMEGLVELWGSRDAAREIAALCDAKVVFRQGGPDSAEFGASFFGECEALVTKQSYNEGLNPDERHGMRQSFGWNHSVDLDVIPNVRPVDLDLPRASAQTGIYGFSKIDHLWTPFWLDPEEVRQLAFGPFSTTEEDAGFLPWRDEPEREELLPANEDLGGGEEAKKGAGVGMAASRPDTPPRRTVILK